MQHLLPADNYNELSLADRVFASVQLQRRQLQENGTWGDWQEVPRSRVEPYGQLFRVVEPGGPTRHQPRGAGTV